MVLKIFMGASLAKAYICTKFENTIFSEDVRLGVSGSGSRYQEPVNHSDSRFLRTRNVWWVPGSLFLGIRVPCSQKPVVACYEMKDKLYPDTSVSENEQKRFFRRVPCSLENRTWTPLPEVTRGSLENRHIKNSLSQ